MSNSPKSRFKSALVGSVSAAWIWLNVLPVMAQSTGTSSTGGSASGGTIKLTNPLGTTTSIPEIVGRVITTALGFIGSLALLMFIYGGVLWLTSRGSAEQVKKGQDVMVWAILGLVLVFSSVALVSFVLNALNR